MAQPARTMSPWRKARISALIVLGFAAFVGVPMAIISIAADHSPEYDFTREDVECSKQRAEPILSALRDFKHRHGVFPDTLDTLARDTNTQLPHCCMHDRPYFYYLTPDADDFRLGFSATDKHFPAWFWQDSMGSWYQDDGTTTR